MSENRYNNGKNSYQPNRYKAQLNHQRAMRAGNIENSLERHKNSHNDYNFDVNRRPNKNKYEHSTSKQSRSLSRRNNAPKYRKKSFSSGSTVVLIIAILLILVVVLFTVKEVINSYDNNNESSVSQIQQTVSETQSSAQFTTQAVTQETTVSLADANNFVTPNPADNNESGTMDNGFYVWNDSIFELFYGDEDTVQPYAEAISRYAQNLGSNIKTYSMIIPTHVEMGLPKRFTESGEVSTASQSENISAAYKNFSSSVTPINCYNELANHCNEYIYFRTDHHWTGLGAYYAYKSFAEATNQDVLSLDTCTKQSIDGFTGTLLSDISGSVSEDKVEYWELPYETTNNVYYESDGAPTELTVYYGGAVGGTLTYGVFIWGDQPLEVLSSDRNTGKKIAIVKESFGNAMVPYFTYNYDEVHVIDFRYWEGNLKSYCEENGITEVLFANGVMSANTSSQIEAMDTLFN